MDNINVKLITSGKNWMEHTAIQQLNALSELEGVVEIVGLPDLHAGKMPVGVAVVTENILYPHIIGSDIGCGMGLFKTGLHRKKVKLDAWVSKLSKIPDLSEIETLNLYGEPDPINDLGTIGGGNHFAEIQVLEEVIDEAEFEKLAIDKNDLFILVHSGSRRYGQSIFNEFNHTQGYTAGSIEAKEYIKKHNNALLWAERNRRIVADKIMNCLGYYHDIEAVIDCKHNFLEERDGLLIHRKGAVSGEVGAVVIPGSRGSFTYVVMPTKKVSESAYSLSHGAGRKWARSLCKSRIGNKYNNKTIRETKLKSRVVCHDSLLLFQEAPEAYKNIEQVIESLLEFELVKIVATLRPVLTFKG